MAMSGCATNQWLIACSQFEVEHPLELEQVGGPLLGRPRSSSANVRVMQ